MDKNYTKGNIFKIIIFLCFLSSISYAKQIDRIGKHNVNNASFQITHEELSTNNLVNVEFSVARLWNEVLLEAIRGDFARPTVHARNLFHTSIAMYDTWAIYNEVASTYLIGKTVHGFNNEFRGFVSSEDSEISIHKTLSYAVFRLLSHRFKNSPNAIDTQERFNELMDIFGYDISITSTDYSSGDPIALGNYIAQIIIDYGLKDGANEQNDYANNHYSPINDPLIAFTSGNNTITDPNRWQPLTLEIFIDQSGNVLSENTPEFLSPEWGDVAPFALANNVITNYQRDSNPYKVFLDPGKPPYLNDPATSDIYKWGFSLVSIWSSHLSTEDAVLWDISPKTIGNIPSSSFPTDFSDYDDFYQLFDGGDISIGRNENPHTGLPYEPQIVPRGDYTRVLAEFWADGPESETPPGHWFVLLNYISDHPLLIKKLNGVGEILSDLEWDIKSYFVLGGAMHDAAVASWSIKGWYDYIRPISSIRYMAEKGQSSDSSLANYHVEGIPLIDNYIETVDAGDPLAGFNEEHVGKIKLYTWRGHPYIQNTSVDVAGVGWILAENWWPYQRPSFVTPPFAGYISGHSTFSRAAAEVLTKLTGSEYFPGGLGEFVAKKNEFLVFEEGPSQDIVLQWATYRDASDQCSLSRIWGGIHPPMDDIPGRIIGEQIGQEAFNMAAAYFVSENEEIPSNEAMLVYPNPVSTFDEINIANTDNNTNFSLFDLLGKKIPTSQNYNAEINATTISIAPLTAGVYILKAKNSSWKIIIN